MDWDLTIRFLLAVVGIGTAAFKFYDISIGKRANLREQYRFAKEFIDDTEKANLHPYTLEKGYQAIAGTEYVTAVEVKYLLNLQSPLQSLSDFILAKRLLEPVLADNPKVSFKKKYLSVWSRRWRKTFYMFAYGITAMASVSPQWGGTLIKMSFSNALSALLLTLPIFGFYAFLSVKAYAKIKRAENLVNNQRSHAPRVVIDKLSGRS